ncbi:MAG: hypothetical protein JOY84_16655 [Curvibacter sp.]|nr:hypothetical protein [Curvibacter sp.]
MSRHIGHPLPRARVAAFWLLLCFVWAQAVTLASPWIADAGPGLQVCSAASPNGSTGDPEAPTGSVAATVHCALCLPTLLPLPPSSASSLPALTPAVLPPWVPVTHLAESSAPTPPPRGPPARA